MLVFPFFLALAQPLHQSSPNTIKANTSKGKALYRACLTQFPRIPAPDDVSSQGAVPLLKHLIRKGFKKNIHVTSSRLAVQELKRGYAVRLPPYSPSSLPPHTNKYPYRRPKNSFAMLGTGTRSPSRRYMKSCVKQPAQETSRASPVPADHVPLPHTTAPSRLLSQARQKCSISVLCPRNN
jgi:hypothetical protein